MQKSILSRRTTSFSFLFLLCFSTLLLFSLFLFSSGTVESSDGWLYLSVARNIYYKHRLVAPPATDYPEKNVPLNSIKGKNGDWDTPGSVGYSLSMVPAVALSDLILRHFHAPPPVYFPLEQDWSVMFFASMTNAWWATIMAVGLLVFLIDLGFSKKQSLTTALLTLFATSLFSLGKHSFAHMMFIALLVWTYVFVRRLIKRHQWRYLFFAVLTYAGVAISYNVAYYIPVFPLWLYAVLLLEPKERKIFVSVSVALGALTFVVKPFLLTLFLVYVSIIPKVFIEGVFGLLLSPGKGLFFYNPLLLILLFFYYKIEKKYRNEIIVFFVLALFFLFFYAKSHIYGAAGQLSPIWYGGMAWGTRYIAVTLPFLMIMVGMILPHLSRRQILLIVFPLLGVSLWIQLVSVSIPYLMQYRDLPTPIFIGNTEFSYYEYASFFPRYSPLITMSHELLAKTASFKRTIDHGLYDVRFYDGFDVPLKFGTSPFRGFKEEGHIQFSAPSNHPLKNITLTFFNVPDSVSASSSARIQIFLNHQPLEKVAVASNAHETISLTPPDTMLLPGKNDLDLFVTYTTQPATQVVYIQQMLVNDTNINLESLDYPDVSTLGPSTSPIRYQYYGNKVNDPWKLWYLRARITERTFDFWWIKNLYYWDRPQGLLWSLFYINVGVVLVSGIVCVRVYKKLERDE